MYKPLDIVWENVCGVLDSLLAARLPIDKSTSTGIDSDLKLGAKLVRAGDDHAKFTRGIVVYIKMECQVGWLIQYLTYRHGIECLSSSSSMHNELKKLSGEELAAIKQKDLSSKVYTRIEMISYQALRNIYLARRNHRHPDWKIFCRWIERLPYFSSLIYPENNKEDNVPDIAMCQNKDCPLKDNCYRFTAKPSERQSYMVFKYDIVDGEAFCESFVKTQVKR